MKLSSVLIVGIIYLFARQQIGQLQCKYGEEKLWVQVQVNLSVNDLLRACDHDDGLVHSGLMFLGVVFLVFFGIRSNFLVTLKIFIKINNFSKLILKYVFKKNIISKICELKWHFHGKSQLSKKVDFRNLRFYIIFS